MPLFDRDRYQRLDNGGGRRPVTSSWSKVTIIVFVALCLIGAWMMSSTGTVPVNVSPEDKEEDKSIDLTRTVVGGGVGGDTPAGDAGDTGNKEGGDTPVTRDDAVDTTMKDDGDATQTTDTTSNVDVSRGGDAVATDVAANNNVGGLGAEEPSKTAGSDMVSKNEMFSDENDKTESRQVVKPEDPDKSKAEKSSAAEEALTDGKDTSGQANSKSDEGSIDNKDTSGQVKSDSDEGSTNTKDIGGQVKSDMDEGSTDTKDTGGQVKSDSDERFTDTKDTGGKVKSDSDEGSTDTKDTSGQVKSDSDEGSTDTKNTGGGQVNTDSDDGSTDTKDTGGQVKSDSDEGSTDTKVTGVQVNTNSNEGSADTKDTGGQIKSDGSTDTKDSGGQAKSDSNEGSTDTKDSDGQDDKNTKETSAETNETSSQSDNGESPTTDDGGTPSNPAALGGVDSAKENDKVIEKSPEQATSGGGDKDDGKEQTTDDDATTGAAASKNQTLGDQDDAPKTMAFAAEYGINGTVSQETGEKVVTNSTSSTSTEEKKPEDAGDGGSPEKATPAELLPSGQADLLNETTVAQNGAFPTQAAESSKSKNKGAGAGGETTPATSTEETHAWKLCNVSAGADYIPCLDNEEAIKKLKSDKHYEHRERHCPADAPACLVPLPDGYRRPIPWPYSRDKIWYHNVPHTKLASYKGNQNWVKVSGEHLTFPGGGTQFKHGAAHYIDLIEAALPKVAWGRRSRVVLDVGCGVASFGGFLFDKGALTMSLAPKDEHEAQVQFALERGIPAYSGVMGTKRLPFPGGAFDVVHCARCRVPWHIEGGKLLLELNRLLRPGGLFVWSATPVYRKTPEDVDIWHAMAALTKAICWDMVQKTSDTVDQTAMVFFKKPTSNECYSKRKQPEPPLCESSDDPNAAWNITLRTCMHELPNDTAARGSHWPEQWPERLEKAPYWLNGSQVGVYGKPAPEDFAADYEHWKKVFESSYLTGMGIDWKNVRNVMDMRSVYGGFAAALQDMNVWVMNVVTIDSPDTLPIIYERGLFGMYHDWCESFSTYPRSYDLVHADHLFSKLKNRCKLLPVIVEVDRILRPEGKLIIRDDHETAMEVESIARSLHWDVRMTVSKQGERLLCLEKTMWRPTEVEATAH